MASIESTIKIILEKKKSGKDIIGSDYPSDFYLPSTITNRLKEMTGYTNPKKSFFSFGKQKTEGSSGNEFAVQFIYFLDQLYAGPNSRGNTSSVSVGNQISVKPEQKGDEVTFLVKIGTKEKRSKKYKVADVSSPLFGSAAIFHTHPKQFLPDGSGIYGFFSPQDIISLLSGSSPFSGLVVGNNVWVAGKTSEAKMIPTQLLQKATQIEYETRDKEQIIKHVRSELKQYGIVFYYGSLTGKLLKI